MPHDHRHTDHRHTDHRTDHWLGAQFDRRQALRLALGAGMAIGGAQLLGGSAVGAATARLGAGQAVRPAAASFGNLRIGYLPITDASPLLIAHASGALQTRGFDTPDPTLFRSWAGIVEAFQADQVDIVHLLMPLAVQLRFGAGQPVKVLTWNHTNGSALTVDPGIDSLADLAGTTVAIPFWYSLHNIVLQQLLRSAGLTAIIDGEPSAEARTVKLVVMGPPDMPPALASGSIAGFIVADPFNALAETNDVGKILRFTGDVWADHACCVTVIKEELVTDTPAAAAALADALAESQLLLRADRVGSARTLSEQGYLPQPLAAIERALVHYDHDEYVPTGAIAHPEWEAERIDFQPYPFPSYTEQLITELRGTLIDGDSSFLDEIDLATAHEQLVATGVAEAAVERAGGPEAFGLAGFDRTELIAP